MKRFAVISLVLATLLPLEISTGQQPPAPGPRPAPPTPPGEVAELQDQLERMLKTRLRREVAFVGRIVDMVEQNQFPIGLVRYTAEWSLRKRPFYPFPYFERAMRIHAQRRGLRI